VAINLPGTDVFGGGRPSGTSFTGTTGLRAGLTADEGSGYETLTLRHDATDAGNLSSVGVTLVSGGARDTLLGTHPIDIDVLAGTIRLGDGPALSLPAPGSAESADFVLTNEAGGELHLDLSAFSGVDYSGTVQGQGSISIDGSTFVPLSFGETDLELANAATGSSVHVDTTAVGKAGEELVTFSGALNLFDLLQGIEADLRTIEDPAELFPRLEAHLAELDQGHERLLSATSALGARSQRLGVSGERAADLGVQLAGLLSSTQDADIAAVALDLAKADASLQLAQSAGSRLLQTTLLNFLS
jgi:flagellin-like hook-associated protein FlgL